MQIVDTKIKLHTLRTMARESFGDLVKAVVDIEKNLMAVDAVLHSDQERELLETGSAQADLWGINLYPEKYKTDQFVEFDSMINLRPNDNNLTRGVDDERIQKKIRKIVSQLVVHDA